MIERFRPRISERLSVPNMLRPQRLREAMGSAWKIASSDSGKAGIFATVLLGSTYFGFSEMGSLQMSYDYLRSMQDVSGIQADLQAVWKLAFDLEDPAADIARRLPLHAVGIDTLTTWEEIASKRVPIPPNVDPESFYMSPSRVRSDLIGHVLFRAPVILGALSGIGALFYARKLWAGEESQSEYTPGYDQIQRRFDLTDPEMIGQIEDIVKRENERETYLMKTVYFDADVCREEIGEIFGGSSKERKEKLESIGLKEGDEIIADETRVVAKNGVHSVVFRVNRDGESKDSFGKETFYAKDGYPDRVAELASRLYGHEVLETLKTRTEVKVKAPYVNPATGKTEITEAILNLDRYRRPTQPNEVRLTRLELVLAKRTGLLPEVVFPDIYRVLGQLKPLGSNDRKTGEDIRDGKI